jgi:hypothetical protein
VARRRHHPELVGGNSEEVVNGGIDGPDDAPDDAHRTSRYQKVRPGWSRERLRLLRGAVEVGQIGECTQRAPADAGVGPSSTRRSFRDEEAKRSQALRNATPELLMRGNDVTRFSRIFRVSRDPLTGASTLNDVIHPSLLARRRSFRPVLDGAR